MLSKLAIRVLRKPKADPEAVLGEDGKSVLFIYDGDPIELLMLGIETGCSLSRRVPAPLKMLEITDPD